MALKTRNYRNLRDFKFSYMYLKVKFLFNSTLHSFVIKHESLYPEGGRLNSKIMTYTCNSDLTIPFTLDSFYCRSNSSNFLHRFEITLSSPLKTIYCCSFFSISYYQDLILNLLVYSVICCECTECIANIIQYL